MKKFIIFLFFASLVYVSIVLANALMFLRSDETVNYSYSDKTNLSYLEAKNIIVGYDSRYNYHRTEVINVKIKPRLFGLPTIEKNILETSYYHTTKE